MANIYDRIYIGTGPIHIVDALLRSKKGEKIALIDSKPQIGGAWVAIPVGEYGRLEIGCHIWSYNRKVYAFLEQFLDLNLVDMKPQPYFLNGSSKMIYDHKSLIITPKYILKRIAKGKIKEAGLFIFKHPAARLPIFPKTYKYPGGGAREFQLKLGEMLDKSTIDVLLNNEIQNVNYENGRWVITGEDGSALIADKVNMTATSHLKSISYKDVHIDLNFKHTNYTHFHIVVSGDVAKPLSYVRLLNNEYIHRISNITNQLANERLNESVLLVGVFEEAIAAWGNDDQAAEKIVNYLKEKGYLNHTNRLIYAQKNNFPTHYIHEKQRELINQLDESIELSATTDLIYGFHYRLKQWKKEGLI